MANITVSSDIDSFLQAADKGAGRTALGASAEIVTPSVGYATTSGNDTTGDGSLAKPYKTAQKLLDAGFTVWRLGVGSFGNVSTATAATFYIQGEGSGKTTIGTVTFTGTSGTLALVDVGRHSFTTGSLSTDAGGSISLSGINVSGAITITRIEGDSGSVTLSDHSRISGTITSIGGAGISGNEEEMGGKGGTPGAIVVEHSYVGGGITSLGGDGGADGGIGMGDGGDGGSVTISQNSYVVGSISSQGATNGAIFGAQGAIVVKMSRVDGTIDPDSGSNPGSLINGTFYTT